MGMMDEIGRTEGDDVNIRGLHAVQTGPNDAQLGEQYRQEMRAMLQAVCNVMTRANRDKIEIGFQLGIDAFGQSVIQMLKISKVL